MNVTEKLRILGDAAKYDVACTSSGSNRAATKGGIGSAASGGICHSFASDGRCISLLKVLLTNYCVFDCKYCQNRSSNDVERAMFTPEELADITINFYRRNYIEGLFLSSGVIKSPDYTTELMCRAIEILRTKYRFNGYIHAKAIPGTSPELINKLGRLIDRISVNIELPSENSLNLIAPQKSRKNIVTPMKQIRDTIKETKNEMVLYKNAPQFAPAGQSTQMIIGATPDTDYQILKMSSALYNSYKMRRVFYSAYVPVGDKRNLPTVGAPLLREHRLYQADWLLRFYEFSVDEILDDKNPSLDIYLDPKCNWAMNHLSEFPIEINTANRSRLLRIPGVGQTSADRIITARKFTKLNFEDLRKMRIVLKRAQYFITCSGKMYDGVKFSYESIYNNLVFDDRRNGDFNIEPPHEQLKLRGWDSPGIAALPPIREDVVKCLTGQM